MSKKLPLAIVALILIAVAYSWYQSQQTFSGPAITPVDYGQDTEFATEQAVSEDDSVSALTEDIENTIILEEDLSDLE